MINKMKALLTAAVLLGSFALTGSGQAITLIPTPTLDSQIRFSEQQTPTGGTYTITNLSSNEYVFGFIVTNPEASYSSAHTTQANWSAFSSGNVPLSVQALLSGLPSNIGPFFEYNENFGLNPGSITNRGFDIGPNSSSSLFTFAANPASTGYALLVDSRGNVNLVQMAAAPEAPVWVMMLLGFAGLGAVSYRASRRRQAALSAV